MSELASRWLRDQSLAFTAAILSEEPHSIATEMAETCMDLIQDTLFADVIGLSDTTLSLIASVDEAYSDVSYLREAGFETLAERSVTIAKARTTVREELDLRGATSGKRACISRVLVSHAVYVLKQKHLSAGKFFKWLQRTSGAATPGIDLLLRSIKDDPETFDHRLSKLLEDSRDTYSQTRDRIDQIDNLYDAVLEVVPSAAEKIRPWWTRVCLGYRNSLFCWPLMIYAGADEHNARGISLPFALFMVPDGKSTHEKVRRNPFGQRIWFKYVASRGGDGADEDRRYQPPTDSLPAHMGGSRLGWDRDWGNALQIGMDVAKKLWDSQNGRLKYSDQEQSARNLTASLNVNMAPACQIVDSVYGRLPASYFEARPGKNGYFRLEGESAEAYWVQCVLGLLLPAREIPMGAITGRILYAAGAYELDNVRGITAKLVYANRAGFPRVVLPGSADDYTRVDAEDGTSPAAEAQDDAGQLQPALQEDDRVDTKVAPDSLKPRDEIKLFLHRLKTDGAGKSIEINFCSTARAAADAMQPSGWRRATFLRLPQLQVSYQYNLRRLYCQGVIEEGEQLRREDRNWYFNEDNQWASHDSRQMRSLDGILASETGRAIKFVRRSSLSRVSGNADVAIGKWLAWKDQQVRLRKEGGYRGPGLGILCFRTTEQDNEKRIWASVADLLDVDPDWWERFQWSSRNQAASMLAELFGNQRADVSISASSAPDVILIFDDGAFTQRRTNKIFPSDFTHQFVDLLNPRREAHGAWDPLDSALRSQGDGPIGSTRIIVIYDADRTPSDYGGDRTSHDNKLEISDEDRRLLEKLSLFRFGCSKQAAYSMLNFGVSEAERLTWLQAHDQLDRWVKRRLLRRNRNVVFLPHLVANGLAGNSIQNDPEAHLHAARALCPILQPAGHFIASNRDRQLEPESVLEAAWHLQRAFLLTPSRFRPRNDSIGSAQAILAFLRSSPDWDTVKGLRRNRATRRDAVELARDLLATERSISGAAPHSSRVGLAVETVGKLYAKEEPSAEDAAEQAKWVTEVVERSVDEMLATSAADRRRQLRFLFSRLIYCLRMLKIPLSDPCMAGARAYTENSITEALDASFLAVIGDEFEGLDDFPLSSDYWRCMWNDEKRLEEHERLTVKQRSTYAYAAARTNLGRSLGAEGRRAPWDEPWIHYFKLAKADDLEPRQLVSPLETWNSVYCRSEESAKDFGNRLLTSNAHLKYSKKGTPALPWIEEILAAIGNLWEFVSTSNADRRLYGHRADVALNFIRVLAMPEVIPAFCFLELCGTELHDRWPREAIENSLNGRTLLARDVVSSHAGWVNMLGSLPSDSIQSLKRVSSWLSVNRTSGEEQLHFADPEALLYIKKLDVIRRYDSRRAAGIWNGFQVLGQKDEKGWAVYGFLRERLYAILSDIDRNSNSWFFALADHRPSHQTLVGAKLLIERHFDASAAQHFGHPSLAWRRQRLLENAKGFARIAKGRQREPFDRVVATFEDAGISRSLEPSNEADLHVPVTQR